MSNLADQFNEKLKYQGPGNEVKEDKLEAATRVFIDQVEERRNKKGIEDTHKRATYLVEKDLLKRFKTISQKQPKGFKTMAINEALKLFLDEFEDRKNNNNN